MTTVIFDYTAFAPSERANQSRSLSLWFVPSRAANGTRGIIVKNKIGARGFMVKTRVELQ